MYSPAMLSLINDTSNRLYPIFNTKQEQFEWFFHFLPKQRWKKITYFRKGKKKEKEKDDTDHIKFLAQQLQISQREVRQYLLDLEDS